MSTTSPTEQLEPSSRTSDPDRSEPNHKARRAVLAASLGNALEWYDITVFAFLASTMTKAFYPGEGLGPTLMTWATFAITFLVRPIGAVIIGRIADRAGRKAALNLTIALMSLGLLIIVLTPTASSIGIWAAVLLILARVLQGVSAGGEFGSATAFMTENSQTNRGFYGSFQVLSQGIAITLSPVIVLVLTLLLTPDQMVNWGFRVAFGFGLLIAPVGIWIRATMEDTDEFQATEHDPHPVATLLRDHFGVLVTAFLCVAMATLSVYLITYIPQYATKNLGLPAWAPYPGAAAAGLVSVAGSTLIGRLTDRIGATRIMLPSAIAGVIVGWPLFLVLHAAPSILTLTLVEVVLGIFLCLYFAPLPALLIELFPVAQRASGMTIAYSFGVAIIGGTAPLVLSALLPVTLPTVPGLYYALLGCALSVVGVLLARYRYHKR